MKDKWAGVVGALVIAGSASAAGDPEKGRAVFVEREQGHCVLCHSAPGVAAAGNVGPSLAGVGARYKPEEIRARVADITKINPAAAMPAFHRTTELQRVAPAYSGKPILTEKQLDDVVAWLTTLK
ncbi:sulfur oxidation c-type cytochrome SoxX [Usitatibacter palustris]|uniref:Cytochrome c domain-containing protein n=1 Tax=Usitatibacter palustris TaxID=2732487 RepID=A0A6M4HBZ1_9PROT|nr:sulfur oxidation c-type cytochrome SoxX [Usitatibacter palustris]QJR16024.1 hypothetical protein DSM104440_02852 [Usitatibacter palustris]